MIDPLCVSGERSGEKEVDDSLLRDTGGGGDEAVGEAKRKEVASLLAMAGDRWRWGVIFATPSCSRGNSSSRSVFHLLYMQHIP